jgi:hypothetical protein
MSNKNLILLIIILIAIITIFIVSIAYRGLVFTAVCAIGGAVIGVLYVKFFGKKKGSKQEAGDDK